MQLLIPSQGSASTTTIIAIDPDPKRYRLGFLLMHPNTPKEKALKGAFIGFA
jgi:hypothetical protein